MTKSATAALMVLALILPAPGFRLAAQTTAHQRLGVSAKDGLEITVGTSFELISSDSAEGGVVEIDPSMSLDFLVMQRFGLSFEVPGVTRFALSRDAAPKATAALGDPSIEATYTFRSSDWRFGAGLSYTHPLGIWDAYESAERRIASGTGYPRLGATLSALRYLDPLVAGVKLGAETCLARTERFGAATKPLILGASFFATEALNSAAALSAGLTSRLSWPRRLEGSADGSSMTWSLSGSVSLLFSEGGRTLRFGVSKILSDYAAPVGLDIGYSYTFKVKE